MAFSGAERISSEGGLPRRRDGHHSGDSQNGSSELLSVHFMPASSGATDHPLSSSLDAYRFSELHWRSEMNRAPSSPSVVLASNSTVAKMMTLMNYEEGTGLGKYGQGIIDPIEMTDRPRNAGLGTVEGSHGRPAVPRPEPVWGNGGAEWESLDVERMLSTLREEGAAYAAAREEKMRRVSARTGTAQLSSHDGSVSGEKEIIRAMEVIQTESASGTLTLGGVICEFEGLKEKFPEAYGTYRLAQTAARLAAPRLRPLLRPAYGRWDLLQRPAWALALVQSLRNMLEEDAPAAAAMPAYAMLINDVVLPSVKAAPWNVSNPEPMIRFVEMWKDTLPPSALHFILDEVVMPELVAEAESWSPMWWTEPGSVWVSPWIPHLGVGRLQRVYVAIAAELGRWMKGRDVTRCAYSEMSQWKDVFDPATWDEFVQRHVVPVVSKNLQDLTISPVRTWGRSNTFPLVMKWALLVPARYMVPVLESEFFAKWRHAVYRFLTEVRSLPAQAAVWYESWKELFTPELLADERVLLQLQTDLDMINRAAQGLEISQPEA